MYMYITLQQKHVITYQQIKVKIVQGAKLMLYVHAN